jgi:hypothetical protein
VSKSSFFIYVFCYELGHCVDDIKRRDLYEVIYDPDALSNLTKLTEDNTRIIRGEFAACYYAAKELTQELYSYLEVGFQREWDGIVPMIQLPDFEQKKRAGAIRVQLSEYAKLVVHRTGNPAFAANSKLGKFAPLFSEWEKVLTGDWARYPNWGGPLPMEYSETWKNFWKRLSVGDAI